MSAVPTTLTAEFEPLLTVKEISVIARLGKSKAYQLIADGVLKATTLPGCKKKLVSRAELRRFLGVETSAA